jgi:hypothetical protein
MEHLDELAQDRVRAGEGSPEEAQHILECLQCKVEVEVLRFMANSMKDAQAVEVPAEVDRAILSTIPRRRRPAWAVFAGSAAAILAVAITLTFVMPAHAVDVVDAYALSRKGGDATEILRKCTAVDSPRKRNILGNRFVAIDVYVEAGERKLAAWQVEITADDRAAIVGVEGGAMPAYHDPPTYDPKALQGGKIVLAAFTTGEAPSGRVRVARLHLMESAKVDLDGRLVAAAAPGGARFDAKVTLERTGESR